MSQVIELDFTISLLKDIEKCIPNFHKEDGQFWRRTAFRGMFGFLEAWMSVNRRYFVPDMLRDHLKEILTECVTGEYISGLLASTALEEYLLNEKGEFDTKKRKLRFVPCLKANIRLYFIVNRKTKEEINSFFQKPEWAMVLQALKVRDRLTHPQYNGDIIVSDEDLQNFAAAVRFVKSLLEAKC